MALTGKCLPTSRRNSRTVCPPVQSRLLTMLAPVRESSKSTNRSSWPRIRAAHSPTTSSLFMLRSPASRGSPIIPVAPPASTSGRCPARWKRDNISSGTRFPACRLGALGSKPAYSVTGPAASVRYSASHSVDCAISPRQESSSRIWSVTHSFSRSGLAATTPLRTHRFRIGQPEPPRVIDRCADPDAGPATHRGSGTIITRQQPHHRLGIGEIDTVALPVDPEYPREYRRPDGVVPRTTGAGPALPCQLPA